MWEKVLEYTAYRMLGRAKTAPKATDVDNLYYRVLQGKEIKIVMDSMKDLAVKTDTPFYYRDAQNLQDIQYIVILGLLGGKDAKPYKNPIIPAESFNATTLGIAIGSALSIANMDGVDTRVMWSVGEGFRKSKSCDVTLEIAYGMPLSISEKNPFMDRRPI